jgi:RHS repeat-associated protein
LECGSLLPLFRAEACFGGSGLGAAGCSTPLSAKVILYDSCGLGCNYGPWDHPGLTQHDPNFGPGNIPRGQPTRVTSNGIVVQTWYDIAGNRVLSSDTMGASQSTGFANNSQVVSVSAGGNSANILYNGDLTTSQVTGTNGENTTFGYAAETYRPAQVQNPDGSITKYGYSDLNQYGQTQAWNYPYVTTVISPAGKVTQTIMDGFGRTIYSMVQLSSSPSVWITTATNYNPCSCSSTGKATQVSRPYQSYATGQPINGSSSQYWTVTNADGLGRTVSVTLPDGHQTTYAYSTGTVALNGANVTGTFTTVTDPMGQRKRTFNDAFGNLLRVEEPDANATLQETARYSYDAVGHMTQVQMGASIVPPQPANPSFESNTSGWSNWGNLSPYVGAPSVSGANSLQLTGPVGTGMYQIVSGLTPGQTYVVSAWVQVTGSAIAALLVNDTSSQNFAGAYAWATYGAWEQISVAYTATSTARLTILLQFGSGAGTINWDDIAIAAQSPGFQQTRTFAYNSMGLLGSATTPEKGTVTYTYYGNGLLNTKTEPSGAKGANQTKTTCYSYDSNNRLLSIQSPQGVALTTFTYDSESNQNISATYTQGRMVSASSSGYTYHYSYDMMGRPIQQILETPIPSVGNSVMATLASYGYDSDGKLTSMTYPGNLYTTQNEGTLATYASGTAYTLGYDTVGRAASLASGGVTAASAGYNESGQLTSYAENNGATNFTRSYDPARGWMTALTAGSALNMGYAYNANGQVISVTDSVNGGQGVTSYEYDSLNRLHKATTPNWTLTYGYDTFGNRTSQAGTGSASSVTQALTYDAASNQITTGGYVYDAAGNMTAMPGTSAITYDTLNRVQSVVVGANTSTMKYDAFGRRIEHDLPDGTAVIYFYDMNGRMVATYNVAPACRQTSCGGQWNGPSQTKLYLAGQVVGQWSDRVGSTRYTPAGSAYAHYYPYGEEITSTNNDTYKFAQTYRDSDSGLDYANARYYANGIGRFLTPDPMGANLTAEAPQGWNSYSYAAGDPANGVDPSGNVVCWMNNANDFLQNAGVSQCNGDNIVSISSSCANLAGLDFKNTPVAPELISLCSVYTSGVVEQRAAPSAPGGTTSAFNCPPQYQAWIDAHGAGSLAAAKSLGTTEGDVLGLSSLESGWGTGRFADSSINDFFNLEKTWQTGKPLPSLEPYSTGWTRAGKNPHQLVAVYTSYLNSALSFAAVANSYLHGVTDPLSFATKLQTIGKFGMLGVGQPDPNFIPVVAHRATVFNKCLPH